MWSSRTSIYLRAVVLVMCSVLMSCVKTETSPRLHLYGGKEHDQYLGCLNCKPIEDTSIWNIYTSYGDVNGSRSIWNKYGAYGETFGRLSPFDPVAGFPPIVLDDEGFSYGYLTIDQYYPDRCQLPAALAIYDNVDEIRKDVQGWYKYIFGDDQ